MPNPSKKPKLEAVTDDNDKEETTVELPPTVEEKVAEIDAKAETNGEIARVSIPFRGREFLIPKEMDEWETEACLAMSQNEYVLAAKLLLGDGQWARLQMLGSKRKDIREFLVLFADVVNTECVG